MKTTQFVSAVVGLVIIILVISSVAIPVVNSAQENQTTLMQNSTQTYAAIESSEDITITYVHATNQWTIDGWAMPSGQDTDRTLIVACDGLMITKKSNVVYDLTNSKTRQINHDASFTFSNGTVSYTIGENNYSASYTTDVYVASATGNYGIFNIKDNAILRVTNGTEISFFTPSDNDYTAYAPSWFEVTDGTVDDSNPIVSLKYTAAGNLVNVYSIEAFSINSTADDELPYVEYTGTPRITFKETSGSANNVTVNGCFIAPIEYIGISQDDSTLRSLFGIIPLMLIITALLYAVRFMGNSRN